MTTDYTSEDVGNIVLLEHINLLVPDQALAILFYVVGMGFTRDPFMTVGLNNMWINVGEQQFHLPTRGTQVLPGHIGIVVPDLEALQARLKAVEESLKGTCFRWSVKEDHVAVTCPWGNRFRCHAPAARFGDMALGIPYIEFYTKPGTSQGIARFYEEVLGAATAPSQSASTTVAIGRNQWLLFRETDNEIPAYDGHHIAVYVANFSRPYRFFRERNLISEDFRNHQFRFQTLADPLSGQEVFSLEHEVRSLRHPMYQRPFVNRDPFQTQRSYRRARDTFIPFSV
jgi:hypothetical protein